MSRVVVRRCGDIIITRDFSQEENAITQELAAWGSELPTAEIGTIEMRAKAPDGTPLFTRRFRNPADEYAEELRECAEMAGAEWDVQVEA